MKHSILFLLFSLSLLLVQAQKAKVVLKPPSSKTYTNKVLARSKANQNCIRKHHFSFSWIRKKYPYNRAAKIQLISFPESYSLRKNYPIDYSSITEVKTLDMKQVDSLISILYNIGFGGTVLEISKINCYNPRNGILFVDSSGKQFAFIEICFECEDFVLSSEKIHFGDRCDQKFSMLQALFKSAGIVYGIGE